jgi:hypothetical protein
MCGATARQVRYGPTVARLLHVRHDGTVAVEDAVQVDVHHAVPGVDRILGDGRVRPGDAGRGNQDIDAAHRTYGLPRCVAHRVGVGDIDGDRVCGAARACLHIAERAGVAIP